MSPSLNKTTLVLSFPLLCSLGACVISPPAGPTFVSLPPAGKNLNTFAAEDGYCRQLALSRSGYTGGTTAGSTATGAVAGTAIGAGAGALIGAAAGRPGLGAAAGAGTGLIAGTAIGASNGARTQDEVQANYDTVYAQCMSAYGNKVPSPAEITPVAVAGYASYGYPVPYYSGYYGYGPAWDYDPFWAYGFGFGGFYGPAFYGRGFYGGYYGRGFYGRGYYGHGYYGRGGYGGFRGGGYGGGFRGGGGFHGGGGGHR